MLANTTPSTTSTHMNHNDALADLPTAAGVPAPSSKSRTVIEATALLVFIVVAACLI